MSFSAHDAQLRRDICSDCRTPCDEHRAGRIDHAAPCESCPRHIWHAWGNCQAVTPPPAHAGSHSPQSPLGLGDLVARYADPLARWIDRHTRRLRPAWRTHLAGCSPCSRRRRRLNRWVRDVRSLRAWLFPLKRLLSPPHRHP